MLVLDDNNSYMSLLTWWWPLQWSQHDTARSMLVDDVVEPRWWRWSLFDVVEPRWWRWSLFDDDAAWRCFDDALCLHSLHWCMWLDPMPYDALEPWVSLMMEVWWLLEELRPCCWWHDTWMEMTYFALMTWYIDGDDIHDALVVDEDPLPLPKPI